MLASNEYQPGFSLIHRIVRSLRDPNADEELCFTITKKEEDIVKEKLDEYVMYIWSHLGDTRYNRSGYRNAVDRLTRQLTWATKN